MAEATGGTVVSMWSGAIVMKTTQLALTTYLMLFDFITLGHIR
jgi:hypothetical protein